MNTLQFFTPFHLTIAVLVLSTLFFIRGKVRSDMVAVCVLLALMLSGILTPSEALAGFSSSIVIMMVGLFVVGAGIFRTGVAKMVGARIVKLAGKNDDLLFIMVMLVTACIGTFISNTGTVAMMMPIVMSMVAGTGKNVRRYLMPLAFASAMGLFTLISTPPNLVIQEAIINAGYKPLSFFSFAPVGAIVVTVGVFMLFFLSRLLCNHREDKKHNGTVLNPDSDEATKISLHKKAPVAAVIMVAMIIMLVLNVIPAVISVLSSAILMVVTGCLRNMDEAYESINWQVVVLIGAMLPMATAFEKTGTTLFITDTLLHITGDMRPYLLLAVIYGCASLCTLFLSNTTTAILFSPIALQAAIVTNTSPYPLLFGVAVAASMCFASPFSTPPNALVMSAGKYTFIDYVKVGLPLQIVMGIVMVCLLPLVFPFY